MPKLEPAVLDLRYAIASGDNTIDLAKGLSQINRKLFRQGRQYYVAGVSVICATNFADSANTNTLHAATAPNSWMTHNAHQKMYNLWNNQQKDAAKDLGIKRPKWADFKVYLDDNHRTGTNDTTQEIMDGDVASSAVVLAPEEWAYSQVVYSDDDGTSGIPVIRDPLLHILGGDNGVASLGIIEQYEESRRTVQAEDPNVPATASASIFAKVHDHDDTMETLVNDLESQNDAPPYDVDQYPGGADNAPHPNIVAVTTTGDGAGALKGFMAPCGLIRFTASAAMDIIIHLMPGNYRGVMAPPMGQ